MQDRKRKTKLPCEQCGLHLKLCICSSIIKINFKTKLSLVIHKREMSRTTNTGQLALLAMINSSKYILGNQESPFSLESILSPDYENLLFYPSDDAIVLSNDLVKSFSKPIHLIVPDGNWRQASKVHYKNKHLTHLKRVTVNIQNNNQYFLRKETKPNGMATLEAIAYAFNFLEGAEAMNTLLNIYNLKLHNTLIGRGINTDSVT